jgi:hypothetical protein
MQRGREPVVWATAALAAFVAALGLIGADALWLVALGDRVVHGHLPSSIPYASAPTQGWHDVPAGAEVLFWAFFHAFGGDRGLVVAQAVAAAIGFGALAQGLQREAASAGAALLLPALVLAGSLPLVVVTGVSLFSLALFPLLVGLLEAETRAPSRRLWLTVPLLALWGNLHGAVLIGWALLACYLVLERGRRRPLLAVAVLGAATAALFLNPALWHTPRYYWSVFHNETARQGVGLWAPLAGKPLDVAFAIVAVCLIALSLRGRRRFHPWEGVAVLGLAAATVHVARTGPWLLFLLAYPAARSLRAREPRRVPVAVTAASLGAASVALLVAGPRDSGARSIARLAARSGEPVLAEAVLGQQVALDGGRIWVDNPIDAFRPADQRLYVNWLTGKPSGASAVTRAALVLVRRHSSAGDLAARDLRLVLVAAGSGGVLYRVRAPGSNG